QDGSAARRCYGYRCCLWIGRAFLGRILLVEKINLLLGFDDHRATRTHDTFAIGFEAVGVDRRVSHHDDVALVRAVVSAFRMIAAGKFEGDKDRIIGLSVILARAEEELAADALHT